jgi:hypothetical protein
MGQFQPGFESKPATPEPKAVTVDGIMAQSLSATRTAIAAYAMTTVTSGRDTLRLSIRSMELIRSGSSTSSSRWQCRWWSLRKWSPLKDTQYNLKDTQYKGKWSKDRWFSKKLRKGQQYQRPNKA